MTAASFRSARKSLGLTQAELAARIGWSRREVGRWETGDQPVPVVVALLLAAWERFPGLVGE